jgi:hypothetical protein
MPGFYLMPGPKGPGVLAPIGIINCDTSLRHVEATTIASLLVRRPALLFLNVLRNLSISPVRGP